MNEPAAKPITFTVVLNWRDLKLSSKAARHLPHGSTGQRGRATRHWLSLGALLLTIAALDQWLNQGAGLGRVVLIEALTAGSFYLVYSQVGDVRSWAGEWNYGVSADAVRIRRTNVTMQFEWPALSGYSETHSHLFLWTKEGGPLIIPERCITDAADSTRLHALIAEKLNRFD